MSSKLWRNDFLSPNSAFKWKLSILCESVVILGDYLKEKFDSLDSIVLVFTVILKKEEKLWGHWRDGFLFEQGQEFASLAFMLCSKEVWEEHVLI